MDPSDTPIMNLSSVQQIKDYIERTYGSETFPPTVVKGYIIYLNDHKALSVSEIVELLQCHASSPASVNVNALECGIRRVIREFTLYKRKSLRPLSIQTKIAAFLAEPFNTPQTATHSAPAQVQINSSTNEPISTPVANEHISTPVALRNDCEKCNSSRRNMRDMGSRYRTKIRYVRETLIETKKKFSAKSANQFRKRKAVQIENKDIELKTLKKLVKDLELDNMNLTGKNEDLLKDNKILNLQIKRMEGEKRKLFSKMIAYENQITMRNSMSSSSDSDAEVTTKENKLYTCPTRKAVYNCLLSNVPVEAVGKVLSYTVSALTGKILANTPSPCTCAAMMREVGVLSDLQAAEAIMKTPSCCLSWDATTKDDKHINTIHINTHDSVFTLNSRYIPGGKAIDYTAHITDTLEDMSQLYAQFTQENKHSIHTQMKAKILSTLTDRAAANHATVVLLEEHLGRGLLELNCQIHPLDGLANVARSTLKSMDTEKNMKSQSLGSDCQAANLLQLISKLRYKAKGDPAAFKAHLRSHGLPGNTFPRYVGNRLHILFHLAGMVMHHKTVLIEYAENFCTNQRMASALKADLSHPFLAVQLQAIGLLGKIVTGPWMALFYTPATDRRHFELTDYLKSAIHRLEVFKDSPDDLIVTQVDIFGRPLVSDPVLLSLRTVNDSELFALLSRLIDAFLTLLKRQLYRYLHGDLVDPTEEQLNSACAAPVHNIWAERNLGMYDAQLHRAPNASCEFIDAKCKATFNQTLMWFDLKSPEVQAALVSFAAASVSARRKTEIERRRVVEGEVMKRLRARCQNKDMAKRRRLERELKVALSSGNGLNDPVFDRLDLDSDARTVVANLMRSPDQFVGRKLSHAWWDEGKNTIFFGRILSVTRTKKSLDVTISYWAESESETDSSDYELKFENVVTDFALGDLLFIN